MGNRSQIPAEVKKMTSAQANMEIDIDSKIKEAEVYYSMGLLDESLGVYKKALSDLPEQDSSAREDIEGKINLLKKENEVK